MARSEDRYSNATHCIFMLNTHAQQLPKVLPSNVDCHSPFQDSCQEVPPSLSELAALHRHV